MGKKELFITNSHINYSNNVPIKKPYMKIYESYIWNIYESSHDYDVVKPTQTIPLFTN